MPPGTIAAQSICGVSQSNSGPFALEKTCLDEGEKATVLRHPNGEYIMPHVGDGVEGVLSLLKSMESHGDCQISLDFPWLITTKPPPGPFWQRPATMVEIVLSAHRPGIADIKSLDEPNHSPDWEDLARHVHARNPTKKLPWAKRAVTQYRHFLDLLMNKRGWTVTYAP